MKKAFGWAYFLQGIFFLGFILSDQLIFGIITLLCMRIAGGIIVPLDTTLLQTYTRENMIGKVFSFHYSIYGSLIQLSMLMTGWLLEILSPQMIGSLLATCCIFVSFIWLYLFYRGNLVKNLLLLNSMFMYMLFLFMSKYRGKRRFIFLTF